jgi:hypothetical protein
MALWSTQYGTLLQVLVYTAVTIFRINHQHIYIYIYIFHYMVTSSIPIRLLKLFTEDSTHTCVSHLKWRNFSPFHYTSHTFSLNRLRPQEWHSIAVSISKGASNLHVQTLTLCVMALCHCLVGGYQHLIGRQCLHLQVHWNTDTHLQYHKTLSWPGRSQYGSSPPWKPQTFSTYRKIITECNHIKTMEVCPSDGTYDVCGLATMPLPLNPQPHVNLRKVLVTIKVTTSNIPVNTEEYREQCPIPSEMWRGPHS